jgi:hypothetical protein
VTLRELASVRQDPAAAAFTDQALEKEARDTS